ncbi:F-box family protein [Trifolium pratense]|uniref:F-box family protein n=2 Tax=Trifolium pratense TaxID=57577 RepID=A0A2K3L7I8_TRIPR|nr:F-box family protein [Trifolium pratense]
MRSLKSLKVKLKPLSCGLSMASKITNFDKELKTGFKPSSLIPDGILDLLLKNSPSADVDILECSRIDDSFDHLAPFSSSLFPEFLQPSSNEHVMADLERRLQHLKQVKLQLKLYIHLATKEKIILEREELIALKEYEIMFLKTIAVLERQMRQMRDIEAL